MYGYERQPSVELCIGPLYSKFSKNLRAKTEFKEKGISQIRTHKAKTRTNMSAMTIM